MSATNQDDKYAALGVDAKKASVHAAFKKSTENDFPGAFINIVRSQQFPGYVKTQHSDGDGSKFILRLLMFYLTGNASWFAGMVDDAWPMNFGDVACGGFVSGEFLVTDTVNQNARNVPKDVLLKVISERIMEISELYASYGFRDVTHTIRRLGGETADLPRQIQTAVFDMTVSGCMTETGVVKGNVRPGDRIWGFASNGQAKWEKGPNSGIMSNGLTLGIDSLIHSQYNQQFPQLLVAGEEFHGRFLTCNPSGVHGMTIAEALLSPTRQWAILLKILIDKLHQADKFDLLHGLSMNTGGGATKVTNVGVGGIRYHKRMPEPPCLFRLIQQASGERWRNMFRSFNCGIGVDVIGELAIEPYLRETEKETRVHLHDLGYCERYDNADKNDVILETPYGLFNDY